MPAVALRSWLLAGLISLAAPVGSQAATVDATDPTVLLNLVKGFGSGTLDKDDGGDPMIKGRIGGVGYVLFFFGCTDNKDCRSVSFYAGWDMRTVTPAQIADWNLNKRFAKAYLDKAGQPAISMDVNLQSGVSTANFEDNLDWWQTLMTGFKADVLDKAPQ